MNPTQKSLLEQMQLHELEIARRKALLGFTTRDAELLAACEPFMRDELEGVVAVFYERQTAVDDIALIIGDSDTLVRLSTAMSRYASDLFSGHYDESYVNNRLRIGMVHKRIGVGPKYYLSAMRLLKGLLVEALERHLGGRPERQATLDALDKLLHFDMEFVFDTYIGSLLAEIESSKDKVMQYAIKLEEKVAERTRELEELSRRDPLTGLFNQRVFRESLATELVRGSRSGKPVALLYFDVDGFKQINDRDGHLVGDDILRRVGQALSSLCRPYDLACRYGGDEFCVLLPGTDAVGASELAQRLLGHWASDPSMPGISVGVAQASGPTWLGANELIEAADRAMYAAKHGGGGQIVVAPASPTP